MPGKNKSFKPIELHEPNNDMMLRKSASVIECSPPNDALLSQKKQISIDNPKANSLEEGKGTVFVNVRKQHSSPNKTATFEEH